MKQKWNRSEGWGIVAARRAVAGLLGVVLLALVAGCDQATSDSGPAAIEVEYVAWIFENIDPNYWSTTTDASAFGNFTIYLKTDQIGDRTVDSVKVGAGSLADDYWTLDSSGDFDFDASTGRIDLPYLYIGSRPDVLYLNWRFTVTMSDGAEATYEHQYKSLNGATAPIGNMVYSPEEYGGSTTGMDAMIPVATVTAGPTWNGAAIEATLSLSDADIANGWAWCYAADGTYIGNTVAAFDWSVTDKDNPVPNNAIVTNYDTSSSPVTVDLSITVDDFTDDSATYDFADIASVVILLTDGYQYTGQFDYDFRSRTDQLTVSGTYAAP